MSKIIVSDTSCLVLLDKLHLLSLLKQLFAEITITPEIEKEFAQPLPEWLKVVEAQNKTYQTVLQTSIDTGEASAIALAIEQKNCLLILDDNKARKMAAKLGIDFAGTLALLVEAKKAGFIQLVKPILEQIKTTDFRINQSLERRILELAKE